MPSHEEDVPLLNLSAWLRKNRVLLSVLVVLFLLFAIHLSFVGYPNVYYDSLAYWTLAGSYSSSGHFNLMSFTSSLRGYLLPMLLAPVWWLSAGDDPTGGALLRLVGAGQAALLFGWLIPALVQQWRRAGADQEPASVPTLGPATRLLLGGLGFLLWRDYFFFPLTDFPGAMALGLAILFALRSRGFGGGVLVGLFTAASLNFRPVYQIVWPIMMLLGLLGEAGASRRSWALASRLLGMAVGAALVLLPQYRINQRVYKEATPFVITRDGSYPNLLFQQLTWGVQMRKYETNVGSDYPVGPMVFVDTVGTQLLRKEGIGEFSDARHYLSFVGRHPVYSLGSWAGHLFNALDVQYATPYIRHVYRLTWPLTLLNYSLLFLAGLRLLFVRWRRLGLRRWVALLALLLPVAATIPMSIECRFGLPLHLLLLALAVCGPAPAVGWRSWLRQRGVVAGVGFLLFVGSCVLLSEATQRSLQKGGRSAFREKRL